MLMPNLISETSMTPFLKQVARHHYDAGHIERKCFVFPNRRSLKFFSKYLSSCVAGAESPLLTPVCCTIDDFFSRIAGVKASDRINLLLVLYGCYSALYRHPEPLDDFIFWGDVLLSDFDDVDKYLVDPEQLFRNVADFKSIQDTYSYLTDTQREAIERFMEHFHKEGRLTVEIDSDNPSVKERFLMIWDNLLPLYKDFNAELSRRGMAYEGMVYRDVVRRLSGQSAPEMFSSAFPDSDAVIFVGLNALNECEKTVMRKMRDAGLAEFCWDYSSPMIRDPRNKSSRFMSENIAEFGRQGDWDPEGLPVPEINVLSVPSSVGQAKQLEYILSGIDKPGIDTAIVLPDENLLIPVLNSIPESISEINVTMGYPMSGSELHSLFNDITALQMHIRDKDGKTYYYHKQVWAVFSNSLFKASLDDDGRKRVSLVKSGAKYYIPQEDLSGHPLFDLIFRKMVDDPKSDSPEVVKRLGGYLQSVIRAVAVRVKNDPDMALELEFARRYHSAINNLGKLELPVRPATYFRLLSQLVGSQSVPFNGEPLKGLQVMGPLETRALDFDNIIILSCNEGVFPRKSVSASFVPPELRKGFGLPTYEHQDAVWAYYFYRMIQRASKVWLVFDSRTEGVRSGEESRYIKQLELHFGTSLKRSLARSFIAPAPVMPPIPKTEEDVAVIRKSSLSASSLKKYLDCPASFYYHTVRKLRPESAVSESLDAGMIGNVFHKTMQTIYGTGSKISGEYLKKTAADKGYILGLVRGFIKEELHTVEVSGRNLIFAEAVAGYVIKTLRRDLELLHSYGLEEFRIIALEKCMDWEFEGFKFFGYLDRMDSFLPGQLRVVDYKTGKVEDEDVDIDDDNAGEVVGKLFGPDNRKRPKIAFQLFLYDMFVRSDPELSGMDVYNSIYQTSAMFKSPIKNVKVNEKFCDLVKESLSGLLKELADTSVPFTRTDDLKTCEWCDFKMICGR